MQTSPIFRFIFVRLQNHTRLVTPYGMSQCSDCATLWVKTLEVWKLPLLQMLPSIVELFVNVLLLEKNWWWNRKNYMRCTERVSPLSPYLSCLVTAVFWNCLKCIYGGRTLTLYLRFVSTHGPLKLCFEMELDWFFIVFTAVPWLCGLR